MKTIEEKAKAYDKATAKAIELFNSPRTCFDINQLTEIFPELAESEDERIGNVIYCVVRDNKEVKRILEGNGVSVDNALAYLEKQKKQKPNFDTHWENGSMVCEQKEQKPDDLLLDKLVEFFEKTAKQYDIDLPHRGYDIYHLCKDLYNFIYTFLPIPEQKPVEKQDYSGLNDFERAIHRGFLCAGVENVPRTIIKETAQDCLAHLPAEWTEEDEAHRKSIISTIEMCMNECSKRAKVILDCYESDIAWLKSLRPSWKPSEEQMEALHKAIKKAYHDYDARPLESLYSDLLKLKSLWTPSSKRLEPRLIDKRLAIIPTGNTKQSITLAEKSLTSSPPLKKRKSRIANGVRRMKKCWTLSSQLVNSPKKKEIVCQRDTYLKSKKDGLNLIIPM